MDVMSNEQFVAKADYEGGLFEAIFAYGMGSKDLEAGDLKNALIELEFVKEPFFTLYSKAESIAHRYLE